MARIKRVPRGRPLIDVFLNIPYDWRFERLYLAYVAGVSAFGLIPHATLEIPGSERRLDRILSLLRSCSFSLHDLSRVELDRKVPVTPRFNMPFELGLAVALDKSGARRHQWLVFEAVVHRVSKSLSDLGGTEVYVHDGTIPGVFRELCNAFVRRGRQPTVPQMTRIYRDVRKSLPGILQRSGAKDPYQARAFQDICYVARASADRDMAT
jgi:hypothetical protein